MILTKNSYWLIAGILNLFTAFLHTIGGQIDLISPLLQSELPDQIKTELLGVWHMVTVAMFATSIVLVRAAFQPQEKISYELIQFCDYLYGLFSLAFIGAGLMQGVFAPQWILLLPIGIFAILGVRKSRKNA